MRLLYCDDIKAMNFILYSAVNEDSIADSLGLPEYSYYFVLKQLRPILEELGEVILVDKPEQEVDPIFNQCTANGQPCVFISFSPPHKTLVELDCPTVSVFAWEFDNIPFESWDEDLRNDWRYVFKRHGRAISLSSHTAEVVKSAMGEDFNIESVPVPVWDLFAHAPRAGAEAGRQQRLSFHGNILDSHRYDISPERIQPHEPLAQFHFPSWDGRALRMGYTIVDDYNSYLGGFYPAETWGAWSKNEQPWVLVPCKLQGRVKIAIDCAGFGPNAGKEIRVVIGDEEKSMALGAGFSVTELEFQLKKPELLIQFLDLDITSVPEGKDFRSLALGLRSITIRARIGEPGVVPVKSLLSDPRVLNVDGIVYTSVFNPVDDRKNWTDIVSAFCYAFAAREDVTLILKMTQRSLTSFLGRLHYLLQSLSPFKCRVIALHGFLEDDEYQRLVAMTTYYVGASGGEGLCLPMMEYMSAGKPAVSTGNTAMEDYIDSQSAFVVESNVEPGFWPHDPRKRLRTLRHRVDWYSLVAALKESYQVALSNPEKYQLMSACAQENLHNFASRRVVKAKLQAFFAEDMAAGLTGGSNV